jgi:hypothetical protein
MLIQHQYFAKSDADNRNARLTVPNLGMHGGWWRHEPLRPTELRVTFLLPGAQYQHQGLPHAAKGRLPVDLGRGAFSYLADRVGTTEPDLY